MSRNLLILCWHNVEGTSCFPARPGEGERGMTMQLRALRRIGNVVDLSDALTTMARGGKLPRRAVALTFDDGYRDNLTIAAPMLASMGLPATFFLAPSLLSGEPAAWWETLGTAFDTTPRASVMWRDLLFPLDGTNARLSFDTASALLKRMDETHRNAAVAELVDLLEPEAREYPADLFLDWDGARQLANYGVSVGSHSLRHSILANEPSEAQQTDFRDSRNELERNLDVAVELLAYPNGTAADFDDVTVTAAREAGYSGALTTIAGWNSSSTPRYELRRFVLGPERSWRPLARLGLAAGEALTRTRHRERHPGWHAAVDDGS